MSLPRRRAAQSLVLVDPYHSPQQEDEPVATGRRSSSFARRGSFIGFGIALLAAGIGLMLGLSDDGYGWAFEMPAIALSGIVGVTASVGTLILGILRQTQQRWRDVAVWLVIAASIITGLGSALLVLVAIAASASV